MNFQICQNIQRTTTMKTCLNKPKLIVCDIDGTLAKTGSIMPSEYTVSILEKLHSQNILFGVASGRDVYQLRDLKDEWPLSFDYDMIIALNGSEYYDLAHDRHVKSYTLKKDDIRDIVTLMVDRFPDINVSIYRDGLRLIRFVDKMALHSKKATNMDNRMVKDLSEFWEDDCTKVMFRVDEEMMHRIEPYCKEISNDRFRCMKTQTTMMEFVNANANKGNALRDFCEENGIDLKDVAAFGDMDNDNELLDAAGLSVCMCNGSEDAKKHADALTDYPNDEDGCARFIEDYLLD